MDRSSLQRLYISVGFDDGPMICYAESVSQGVPLLAERFDTNQPLAPDLGHTSVGNVASDSHLLYDAIMKKDDAPLKKGGFF